MIDSPQTQLTILQEQLSEYQRREREKDDKLKEYSKRIHFLENKINESHQSVSSLFSRQVKVESKINGVIKANKATGRLGAQIPLGVLQDWSDTLSMTDEDRARFDKLKKGN